MISLIDEINNAFNYLKLYFRKKENSIKEETRYSDFDYESLTKLYFDNRWLQHQCNSTGFENLWFDFEKESEKKILTKLINNFTYLKFEDAEMQIKDEIKKCLADWQVSASNTLFIGFQKHNYPDGSQVLLNLFKPIFAEIDPMWRENNFLPNFDYGVRRIKKDGFKDFGVHLKKVILVDDFIGTGGTVQDRILTVQNILQEHKKDFDLKVFCVAAMEEGIKKINDLNVECSTVHKFKKATLLWNPFLRAKIRNQILGMEKILYEGSDKEPLSKFNLGYGKSETLYSLSKFNLPNNNFPLFWWNRYNHGGKRKTLFNRMQ